MSQRTITLPDQLLDLREMPAQDYVLDDALADAVEVAIALGQPLLVTGAPGTGKTRLAWRIAHDLHQQEARYLSEPLVFSAKTTSTAQDLFYRYDALSHFHDANLKKEGPASAPPSSEYIQLNALGKAIALSDPTAAAAYLSEAEQKAGPRSAVVLIDEIDKAPRDFPNDLLMELEQFSFQLREAQNQRLSLGRDQRIVVLMTSNSEKSLPEAFLRRCVFYHIPSPGLAQLQRIVAARIPAPAYSQEALLQHFLDIRKRARRKAPATAELLAWLRILELHRFLEPGQAFELTQLSESQQRTLRLSYTVLAKTQEDLSALLDSLQ